MSANPIIEEKKEMVSQKEVHLTELRSKLKRDEEDLQEKVMYLKTLREELNALIESVEDGTKENDTTKLQIQKTVADIDQENKNILEVYRQEEIEDVYAKQPDFYSTLFEILEGKIESFNTGLTFETKSDPANVVDTIKRAIDGMVIDNTTVLLRDTKKAFEENLKMLCTRHVDKAQVSEKEKLYRIDMIHSLLNDSRIRSLWV